jgi:hypothetical protein
MFKLKFPTSGFYKKTSRSQIHSVPRGAILSFCSDNEWPGVQFAGIAELTTLAVTTANSLYEITILDGSAGDVLVQGGHYFPERTATKLSGSSFGGSFLRRRWICPGMRLEFVPQPVELVTRTVYDEITGQNEIQVGHPAIWTSVVQSVRILT